MFLGLAALAVVALLLVDQDVLHTSATQDGTMPAVVVPDESPVAPRSAASPISSRAVDSAALPSHWTSPSVDIEEIKAASQRGIEPLDLVFENYDANAELVHWATGDADDSERGDELAKCYRMATGLRAECDWGQRVIVKRTGERSGQVVHVETSYDPDKVESACVRMIACAMATWQDAVAPLPPNGEDYVTLDFVGSPCFLGAGLDDRDRNDAFAEREEYYGEQARNYEQCDRVACRYNAGGLKTCLRHMGKMQQYY